MAERGASPGFARGQQDKAEECHKEDKGLEAARIKMGTDGERCQDTGKGRRGTCERGAAAAGVRAGAVSPPPGPDHRALGPFVKRILKGLSSQGDEGAFLTLKPTDFFSKKLLEWPINSTSPMRGCRFQKLVGEVRDPKGPLLVYSLPPLPPPPSLLKGEVQ